MSELRCRRRHHSIIITVHSEHKKERNKSQKKKDKQEKQNFSRLQREQKANRGKVRQAWSFIEFGYIMSQFITFEQMCAALFIYILPIACIYCTKFPQVSVFAEMTRLRCFEIVTLKNQDLADDECGV